MPIFNRVYDLDSFVILKEYSINKLRLSWYFLESLVLIKVDNHIDFQTRISIWIINYTHWNYSQEGNVGDIPQRN